MLAKCVQKNLLARELALFLFEAMFAICSTARMTERNPTDNEMRDVIVPILLECRKDGMSFVDATEVAVNALREHWPKMPLRLARAAVTRLRNI